MVDQQRRRLSWGGAVPLLYRLLVVAGVSGDGSPGGRMGVPLGTARFVLGFGNAGEEDRTATLRALQLNDYTCWMLPIAMNSTVCIKNRDPPEYLPETPVELRSILGRVNLRSWLPNILCTEERRPAATTSPDDGISTEGNGARDSCRDLVESALAAGEQNALAGIAWPKINLTASSTLEEKPWMKALKLGTSDAFRNGLHSIDSRFIKCVLATARGTEQLRPALQIIKENTAAAITPSRPDDVGSISIAATEKLLSLLPAGPEATVVPSLRVDFPKRSSRVGGSVVPFVAEVRLGTALETRRAAGCATNDEASTKGKAVSGGWSSRDRDKPSQSPLPVSQSLPLERCELRILVDELEAMRFHIAPSGTTNIRHGLSLVYAPRCSKHPDHDVAVAAGKEWWRNDKDAWYVEARTVDRVCTRDVFGSHSMRVDVVCYQETGHGDDSTRAAAGAEEKRVENGDGAAGTATPATPGALPFEVITSAQSIEYVHTANGAGAAVSSGEKNMEAPAATLGSLPDQVSVSLYLDGASDTSATVTVPRWSSDGEVWQVAFEVCSTVFGPERGVLVDTNDCIDLATAAIRDKMVDLYHQVIEGLMVYLGQKLPGLEPETILGHIGRIPEKIEELGAALRDGGEHLEKVCEVGFNAGHSSLNWLMNSRPSVRVLAFDLGETEYMPHAVDFLQTIFPGRLEVVFGDSKETIPAYTHREELAGRDPRVCNVIFVDGDHDADGAYADLVAFERLANRTWHALMIDDMNMPAVAKAWAYFSKEGRGRLERVVEGKGQHASMVRHTTDTKDTWEVIEDTYARRAYMSFGSYHLGIGHYRLPRVADSSHAQYNSSPQQAVVS